MRFGRSRQAVVTDVFPSPRYMPSFLLRTGCIIPTFHFFMLVDFYRINPTRPATSGPIRQQPSGKKMSKKVVFDCSIGHIDQPELPEKGGGYRTATRRAMPRTRSMVISVRLELNALDTAVVSLTKQADVRQLTVYSRQSRSSTIIIC